MCRLTNTGDRGKASLRMVHILSLPELTTSACLRWAMCFSERPGHALFSKSHQQHPPSRPYHFLSTNSSSGTETGLSTVVMQVNGLSGYFRTINLTLRCRTLLEFANINKPAGATVGSRADSALEWEKWGLVNMHILEHDSLTWGSPVRERRATVGQVLPTQNCRRSRCGTIIRSVCVARLRCWLRAGQSLGRRSSLSAGVLSKSSRRCRRIVVASGSAMISRRACLTSRLLRRTLDARVFSWMRIICWRRCARR